MKGAYQYCREPSAGSDLSYLNARVRGWRGRLFKEADYHEYIGVGSIEECIELLASTGYQPDLAVAGARFERDYDIFTSALRSNLSRTFTKLWDIAPEGVRVYFKALFSTWEVYNIKALLRGIDRGVSRDELFESLVPVGELSLATLKVLVRARDITDLLRFLHTWGSPYAEPLSEGLAAYRKHHTLVEMETNLDVFSTGVFASTISSRSFNGRLILDLLADRIDTMNIMTLMKVVVEDYPEETLKAFFMEGGRRLLKKNFLQLAGTGTRDGLLGELPNVLVGVLWRRVLLMASTEEMSVLEENFEDLQFKTLSKISIQQPLSMALAAAFIYAKIREIKNLRLIARGKIFSLPENVLERFLIY